RCYRDWSSDVCSSDLDHVDRIDSRLNQNLLVGQAVTYLDQGLAEYAQGESVWNGVLALVPRAIWPGKPVAAGSAGLVSRFTGVRSEERRGGCGRSERW